MAGVDSQRDARQRLVFTVDVEDWGQSVLDPTLPISDYAADNALRLLDLISQDPNAKGTFFVLGKFAEKHPQVVRRIRDRGHEIASHGHGHLRLDRLTRREFRDDLRRGADIIANAIGVRVTGYRAPQFSIIRDTLWALQILCEEGYQYDSSIFPFDGSRYGIGDWPLELCRVRLDSGMSIAELPPTVASIVGRRVPIGGGGYARLLPGRILVHLLRREATRRRTQPIFYCHPYEIDPGEFRRTVPTPPWGSRRLPLILKLHQGIGRRGFASKLRLIMRHFEFQSCSDALAAARELPEIHVPDCGQADDRWIGIPATGTS